MTDDIESGQAKLDWVRAHMPVHAELRRRLGRERPFAGITIGVCSHIEAKTGVFIQTLAAAGAKVVFTGSEPGSSQNDVVTALNRSSDIVGYARRGVSEQELAELHRAALAHAPVLILDDAGELTARLVHERPDLLPVLRGVCEQTTTGVQRLQAMFRDQPSLGFPAYAVNDTPMKHEFDNVHGTGESALSNLMATTNLLLAGKEVIVAGFGDCGQGIAQRARAWGAQVSVTEVEPRRALRAYMQGFRVTNMLDAATYGEIFITATGNKQVIGARHFERMRAGAVLANAGHFNVEIDAAALARSSVSRKLARPGVEQFTLDDGRSLFLVAEGRLLNLATPTAMGHPIEVMDQTFAMQIMAARDLLATSGNISGGVHRVPDHVDREVAQIKLATLEITIDGWSDSQRHFLDVWKDVDIKPGAEQSADA